MTAGEKLLEQVREQGVEEGRNQGLLEGRREALRLLLLQRFKLTELPREAEARVRDASQAEVEVLLKGVLEADSLSDLFGA